LKKGDFANEMTFLNGLIVATGVQRAVATTIATTTSLYCV
jgi:hypothetical protein